MQLLSRLLLVATTESLAQHESDISPRSLFAAVFDVAFGADVEAERAQTLDAIARPIVATVPVNGGLSAYLAALIASDTSIGRVLRDSDVCVNDTDAEAMSDADVAAVRAALAPRLAHPLSHDGYAPVGEWKLSSSAAAALEAAASQLASVGVPVTVLSAWRSHEEQREAYEAITTYVSNTAAFRVGRPGTSLHERGLAVDIAYPGYTSDFRATSFSETQRHVRRVFHEYGWYQFDPVNDAVHFSFGRIG